MVLGVGNTRAVSSNPNIRSDIRTDSLKNGLDDLIPETKVIDYVWISHRINYLVISLEISWTDNHNELYGRPLGFSHILGWIMC
jgi:hypothetical protein